jgi:hypothetical protein
MREVNKRRHYFGNHPPPCNSKGRFHQWIRNMQQLAQHLRKRGVEVVNCTPGSALTGLTVSTLEREFPVLRTADAQVA